MDATKWQLKLRVAKFVLYDYRPNSLYSTAQENLCFLTLEAIC